MKIKMHYLGKQKNKAACGRKKVHLTDNYREITCGRCLATWAHRTVKAAVTAKP